MSDLPTQNVTAAIVNKVENVAIEDLAVPMVKAALVLNVPFLGWPVFSQVTDYILGKAADFFYVSFATYTTFAIIDAQTENEAAAAKVSAVALQAAVALKDKDATAKALADFKAKYAALGNYDGAAQP